MEASYRALVCVTTCERAGYLERYLPHFARAAAHDRRLSLLVSADGTDAATVEFCRRWAIPLIHSEVREGVGLSKNRALERFPEFDYYFFIEDDTELVDGRVFNEHIGAARASGIHHFSLFRSGGLRGQAGSSTAGTWRIRHGRYGGGRFSFFTAEGLRHVGGWHPRFAEFRRWGHTEHSYRFVTAGLAPAPFNVIDGLERTCIWHHHPSVITVPDALVDEDHIAAPERELMEQRLSHVPLKTLSPYHFNGAPFEGVDALAATLDRGARYPLLTAQQRRQARSDYYLWRFEEASGLPARTVALMAAAVNRPGSPTLRHSVRTAFRR
jgi:hypothetical protein